MLYLLLLTFSAKEMQKERIKIKTEEEDKNKPGLGKLGTTRILVLMPWIRGSSSLQADIVEENRGKEASFG